MKRIGWITAFTVIVAIVVALNLTPWVRGGYGWRWPYIPVDFVRVLPLLLATIGYTGGGWLLLTRTRRTWPTLLWSVAGTVVLSLAVAHAREGDALYALFTRTASAFTTGPHWAATQVDWAGGEWRNWPDVMQKLGGHLATAPPGVVMLYGLLNDLFGNTPALSDTLHRSLLLYQCHNYTLLAYTSAQWASASFGMLMPLWVGLTALPLFAVARRLKPDADARVVVLWWALVPGVLAFASSWSTIYPLLTVLDFWLILIGMEQSDAGKALWPLVVIIAGLLTGLATFVNFALLPLPGLLGFYTLLRYWRRFRKAVLIGLYFGIGLSLPWVLYGMLTGETPLQLLQAAFDYHLDLDRPYWFWVWMHVWDWLLWTGVGLGVLWLLAVINWGRADRANPPILALAVLLTILVMTISGTTQGESGRIWLFVSPCVVLAAWETLRPSERRAHRVLLLTVGQAALMLALTANLAVIGTDFTRPPSIAGGAASRQNLRQQFRASGGSFELTGWNGKTDNDTITLELLWQGIEPPTQPYWFGAFLVGPDGSTTEPVIWQPNEQAGLDQRYPVTCWDAGEIITDAIHLPLPENAAPGDWWVSLAAFGDETQPEGRLLVTSLDGSQDNQVGLGPVVVPAR